METVVNSQNTQTTMDQTRRMKNTPIPLKLKQIKDAHRSFTDGLNAEITFCCVAVCADFPMTNNHSHSLPKNIKSKSDTLYFTGCRHIWCYTFTFI